MSKLSAIIPFLSASLILFNACQNTSLRPAAPILQAQNNSASPLKGKRHGDILPGEYIVKLKAGTRNIQALLAELGPARQLAKSDLFLVQQSSDAKIQTLSRSGQLEFFEPNRVIRVQAVRETAQTVLRRDPVAGPNDELFSQQYAHQMTHAAEGWALASQIKPAKTDIPTIAIVDSGIDRHHPDLKERIAGSYNVFNPSYPNGALYDPFGHGTHCAGIAAALVNNAIGVAGVAPQVQLVGVKVLDEEGAGTNAGVAEGIMWATDSHVTIMNLSLGSLKSSIAIRDAVLRAIRENVLVVAAMGNEGTEDPSYPAAYEDVMAIGSTNSQDEKSNFSQFGKHISVAAPGSQILSTLPTYGNGFEGKNYGKVSGTSMAAPYVAGLAALVKATYPHLGAPGLRKAIELGAEDKGEPGFDKFFGHGRVSVPGALRAASKLPR